ncbi:MAG: flavodoxin family protein [Acidimicrobiales bacterium]|jgi:flavodoxin|nr:flavodoxin family protein [Acidimicrobiales bacterium]MDP6298234.1 flavodoxin family protein [Acidimicrobiales bacterium]HJM29042.1 flavodoxin family protein [Acidimicrobiales bacterium]HJM98385.1 flavodoxin family protein [Acidimicrobiales bacterium]
MKTAILYQSLRGGTKKLAHSIAEGFVDKGSAVGVFPITNINAQYVLNADLLVIGTWTDGLFGLGARPAQLGKLNLLPDISHRNVALFVTYEISPEKSLKGLCEWTQDRGASIVTSSGFKVRGPFQKNIQPEINSFVDNALSHFLPTET